MPPSSRPNTKAATDVADGIAMIGPFGRHQAAHYMRLCGISFAVIVRVLTDNTRRRAPELAARSSPAAGASD